MEIISKDFLLQNLKEPLKEVYTIPLLQEEFCTHIIDKAKQLGFETNQKEDSLRQMPECAFNTKCLDTTKTLMEVVIRDNLNSVFMHLWRQTVNVGHVQVANYNPRTIKEGNWHHDYTSDISVVIPLNTGEYIGGGTEFWKKGILEPLPTGSALIFPSFINCHRGLAVDKGDRFLLVFWLKYVTNQFD